jgi:hypothetical protein
MEPSMGCSNEVAAHRVVRAWRLLFSFVEQRRLELLDRWLQERLPLRQQLYRLLEAVPRR